MRVGQLVCDGAQVHGLLDQLGVVEQAHLLPLDRFAEVHALAALHQVLDELVTAAPHGIVHRVEDDVGGHLGALVAVALRRGAQTRE